MTDTRTELVDDILQREHVEGFKSQVIDLHFEMSAENYETFDERISMRYLSEPVVQVNRWLGMSRSIQLFKDSHVFQTVEDHRKKTHQQYRLSLACLKSEPQHVTRLEWKWISTAVATAVWSCVLLWFGLEAAMLQTYLAVDPQDAMMSGILMSTVTVIALLLFWYQKRDQYVFSAYQSGVPLITLDNLGHRFESSEQLLVLLKSSIRRSQQHRDMEDILVCELKEIRRLRDEEVVTQHAYEEARSLIFAHPEFQAH